MPTNGSENVPSRSERTARFWLTFVPSRRKKRIRLGRVWFIVMSLGYAYVAVLAALTVLSIRTLVVLKAAAPWTSLGWVFTVLYDSAASGEIIFERHLPFHIPYVFLAALALAFVVAGARDEPQADPWWWPGRLALTRAQKRAKVIQS